MNGFLRFTLLLLCIYLIDFKIASAQSSSRADFDSPIYKAEQLFNSAIKQQSLLYNGPAFHDYPPTVDGSANFQDLDIFSKGSVIYQGFKFDSVALMYNMHQDKLVSKLGSFIKYSFISEKVDEFYLNNHHFKYINVIDTVNSVIKSGFYDLIHDGKSKIYVKRVKNMQYSLEDKVVRYYFVPKIYYYIERNQKFSTISSEKSFLNYFKDKKPELKKLLKEKKIRFRKQPEVAMALVASYYESLTN